jgi:hypothetical protein
LRIQLADKPQGAYRLALATLAKYPDANIATVASRFTSELWGGSPELYMKFVDAATEATRAKFRGAMYPWLVARIPSVERSDEYKHYPVDWKRVWSGCHDLIALDPKWIPSYHHCAKLARKYRNVEAARELFERPELGWYKDADALWGGRVFYDDAREWALSK